MAIEKMALVSIEGNIRQINRTLMKCCESHCFHIIPSIHDNDKSIRSAQHYFTLKNKNLYYTPLKLAIELSELMNIKLVGTDYTDVPFKIALDFKQYFKILTSNYKIMANDLEKIDAELKNHKSAIDQLERLYGLGTDFQHIFAMKYVSVRFGRIPTENLPKLEFYKDKNFFFFPYDEKNGYTWCVYFTPRSNNKDADNIFDSLFFERVRLPDFRGNAAQAKDEVEKLYKQKKEEYQDVVNRLEAFKDANKDDIIKVSAKLKAYHDSFEIRKNAAVSERHFFVSGYVPEKDLTHFHKLISELKQVDAYVLPRDFGHPEPPPVQIKNNFIFKPFEMFVKMYGQPSYGIIDPTVIVGITYMLMYGMMFGDVGQGIVLSIFGILLGKLTRGKFVLAPIMTRVGICGAIFGCLYGSIFGSEEIITPIFHHKAVYTALGFTEAPTNIFSVAIYLLLMTLALGICVILLSMILNMFSCFRGKDYENAILSPNGIAGFILYGSIIFFAISSLAFGQNYLNPITGICFIGIPVLLLFFKSGITKHFRKQSDKAEDAKIRKNKALLADIEAGEKAITKYGELDEILQSRFFRAQSGRISYANYRRMLNFSDRDFTFVPTKIDHLYISGTYIAPKEEFPRIDKLMTLLGFDKTGADETSIVEDDHSKHTGFGMWFLENCIEMFDIGLSYFTNTLSFLRIGGFIMSHAGLMTVVETLAENFGGDGITPVKIIIMVGGNIFVIALEGFLVGIQTLRLELYEIFSRFYTPGGKPFTPISADIIEQE